MYNKLSEDVARQIWGVVRSSPQHCVCHDQRQTEDQFRDELSWKEFQISGLCQTEQNKFFNSMEE